MNWHLDGRPLRRVLISRLRYLGDIAMSTVLLTALHRGDSELRLDYLCEEPYAPLLAGHPLLSQIHALDIRRTGADAAARAPSPDAHARNQPGEDTIGPGPGARVKAACRTAAMTRSLRREGYDLVVDLFFNPRSAWLFRFSGVPKRIGGAVRGYRKHLYTHLAPSPSRSGHPELFEVAGGGMGEHLCRLAPLQHRDGRPFLTWLIDTWPVAGLAPMVNRPALGKVTREVVARFTSGEGRYVLLAPGATWASKEWPVEQWHVLIRGLIDAGRDVLILRPPCRAGVYEHLGAAIPAGRGGVLPFLPLARALEVVGSCSMLVAVDGGIMHAAVAMEIPTLGLFGPTDPSTWFPYERLGPYRVLAIRPPCHPCHRHDCDQFICMPGLPAARVLAVVHEMFSGQKSCRSSIVDDS